jgi:glycosyltransferase involved in cell wall biosynthesis
MRILLATGIFKPELGGPATLAQELAGRLETAGHDVTVVTYSDKPFYDFDESYKFKLVRIVRSNKLVNYLKYFLKLVRLAPRHDFIYTLDWFSAGMPVLAASLFTGKKYIVRVGGGYIWEKYLSQGKPPVTLKEFYEKKLYRRYRIMYEIIKVIFNHATFIIFNSDEQRKLYEKFYKIKPEKTTTIYNATPEHKFGTLLKTYKFTTELENRDKEIVFFGRFIKMKNAESLVMAFAKLQDLSYKLLLIGEGPTEPLLRALVLKLGIAHRVTFLPSMPQKDLYRRIANCAYVVIPSWTDISPHQAFECLAQGIPFLLTKENYLPLHAYSYLTIDPRSVDDIAEKMNYLADPKNYDSFVKSLAKISYRHTLDEATRDHLQLFRQLR